jgi:hypothetical protein
MTDISNHFLFTSGNLGLFISNKNIKIYVNGEMKNNFCTLGKMTYDSVREVFKCPPNCDPSDYCEILSRVYNIEKQEKKKKNTYLEPPEILPEIESNKNKQKIYM